MIRRIADTPRHHNGRHGAGRRSRWPAVAGLALMALVLVGVALMEAAEAACATQPQATVPLQLVGAAILVTVQVNGADATFKLDTGAQRSVVTDEAVQRLHLARDEWVGTTMSGIGGIERRSNADPRTLTLGGVPLVRRTLNRDNSLTVGILPHAHIGSVIIDGLLGRDFLSLFDLDIDMTSRQLTLYHVDGCAGRFLPWTSAYTSIGITMPAEQAVMLPVNLDGVALRALLDTGADSSLVAAPGLLRLGLEPGKLNGDPSVNVGGLGPRIVTMHQHQFGKITIGGESRQQPTLWVAPIRLIPFADMLVGSDWLIGRRVWLSYATQQLFIATGRKGG